MSKGWVIEATRASKCSWCGEAILPGMLIKQASRKKKYLHDVCADVLHSTPTDQRPSST